MPSLPPEQAIALYNEALGVDPDNSTYLNNRAAAECEKGDLDTCIATCKKALELAGGDFHSRAKVRCCCCYPSCVCSLLISSYDGRPQSFARIGSAQLKRKDLDAAIQAFRDSMLEVNSKAVERKLKDAQARKRKRDEEEYQDPALANEAKERGNEHFKVRGAYPLPTPIRRRGPHPSLPLPRPAASPRRSRSTRTRSSATRRRRCSTRTARRPTPS